MSKTYRNIIFFFITIFALVGVLLFVTNRDRTVDPADDSVSASVAPVYLATSTMPLIVSGVVEAADSAVIYAKVGGVVTSLPVREGGFVSEGALLAVQATPVLDAEYALAAATGKQTTLEQELAAATRARAAEQAALTAYSTEEIATLRAGSNDARVREATAALLTTLETNVLVLTQAADFVNTHRELVDADERDAYEAAVALVYGEVPDYLRDNVAVARSDGASLADIIDALRTQETPDAALVGEAANIVREALHILYGEVFVPLEKVVLEGAVEEEVRERYDEEREALLTTMRTLHTARAAFDAQLDVLVEDAATRGSTVEISALDSAIAARYAADARRIEAQSREVVARTRAVVAARQALGRRLAPFGGTVAEVYAREGEYVAPGTPLLSLVGDGAREVFVPVPAFATPYITVGAPFRTVEGVVGAVVRRQTVGEGGSTTVVIGFQDGPAVGTSVRGELAIDVGTDMYAVPRAYLHFDTEGPFVRYEDGGMSRAAIEYDSGDMLYARLALPRSAALLPAGSITL